MPNALSPKRAPFVLIAGAGFTPKSDFALDQAARIAARIPGCELHVVRVVASTVTAERAQQIAGRLEAYMADVATAIGQPIQHFAVHVRPGKPSRVIASLAAEVRADLIVLGAKETGLKNLFAGSVAQRTLAIAPCPVVVAGARAEAARVQSTAIEPTCDDCLRVRAESSGADWWCPRHTKHHVAAHAYRYRREIPLREHDSSVVPTGIDIPRMS